MHILLATDGSETADLAQAHILALPWPTPVHVTVMTSIEAPPPFTSLTPEAHGAYTSAVGVLRHDVERKAADVVREARRTLEPHVEASLHESMKGLLAMSSWIWPMHVGPIWWRWAPGDSTW